VRARSAAPAGAVAGLLLAGAVLLPQPAAAFQLGRPRPGSALPGAQLDVHETFYWKYNLFLDEDSDDGVPPPFPFHEFVDRTVADLRIGQFSLGVQMDFAAIAPTCKLLEYREKFATRYGEDADCVPPNSVRGDAWKPEAPEAALFRLEKAWARWSSRYVDLQLGDFYAAIGRGLTLSMVKKPEVDRDDSLFGGRLDIRSRPVDWTLLAGFTNPQEVSLELRNRGVDRTVPALVGATSLEFRPTKGLELGAYGVGYELTAQPSWAVGGSVGANGLGRALDLFFEGDAFFYGERADAAGLPRDGHAFYGAATLYTGALTLLVEGKHYVNAQALLRRPGPVVPLQYSAPPSLEHEGSVTEDVNGSIGSNAISGWKVQGDLFLTPTAGTVSVALASSLDEEPHPPFSPQWELTMHPWMELDQPIPLGDGPAELHLAGSVGYRHDFPVRVRAGQAREFWRPGDSDAEIESEYLRSTGLLHWKADLGISAGKHAFEIVSSYRRHAYTLESEACWETKAGTEKCDRDDGWISVENAISYTLLGRYTVALHVDYTDDPIVQRTTNGGTPGNLIYDEDFRASAYIGGELILRPVDNLEVAAFWGSQKSGIVCTGGACRTVPSFTGAKVRVSISF
jgi:hypothetical protein